MTATALATPFVALVAAAAWMSSQPAMAGPRAVASETLPAARPALDGPESPGAAFERLLATRTPARSGAVAPDRVDPLLPPFRAALWSAPAPAPLGTAAAGASPEVQK